MMASIKFYTKFTASIYWILFFVSGSTLKKSRFPCLIEEIQKYIEEHKNVNYKTEYQIKLLSRRKNRNLKERLEEIIKQRDHLASLLVEADTTILELHNQVAALERKLSIFNIVVEEKD